MTADLSFSLEIRKLVDLFVQQVDKMWCVCVCVCMPAFAHTIG